MRGRNLPRIQRPQIVNAEKNIQITVKLFAHFCTGRFKESQRSYPEWTCVSGILNDLRITDVSSGIMLVNGRPAAPDLVLYDGDTLALFPLVSGG